MPIRLHAEFTIHTLTRTLASKEDMLKSAAHIPTSNESLWAIGSGLLLGGYGWILFWGIYEGFQKFVNEPVKLAGGAELSIKTALTTIKNKDGIQTIEFEMDNGGKVVLTEEPGGLANDNNTLVYASLNGGLKERIPHTNSLKELQKRCLNDFIEHESMYHAHYSITTETLDEIRFHNTPGNVKSNDLHRDFVANLFRARYVSRLIVAFVEKTDITQIKNDFYEEIRHRRVSDASAMFAGYQELAEQIKRSSDARLDEIATLIAEGDKDKSRRLIINAHWEVIADAGGIHFLNKINAEKSPLVIANFANPENNFPQFAMRLRRLDQDCYVHEFVRTTIKNKFDEIYCNEVLMNRLKLLVGKGPYGVPAYMLNYKGTQLQEVLVGDKEITATWKTGEFICFSRSGKFRGQPLEKWLEWLKTFEAEITFKEGILCSGALYDTESAEVVLGKLQEYTARLLGLPTGEPFDLETKQLLLNFEMAGVKQQTTQEYFENSWNDQATTKKSNSFETLGIEEI